MSATTTGAKQREEIERMAASMNGHNSLISLNSYPKKKEKPWPKDLAPEAYHGLAGEIVKTLHPHTEADAAALLLNFLVAFSSVIGRNAHFTVSGSKNYLNLFGILVGKTSNGRKGLSWGVIKEIFKGCDPEWQTKNLASGLSSGEGLIWRVRDPIYETEPIKEKGKTIGHQDEMVDAGIADKRLLVVEGEFAKTLKLMSREGNILSSVIREAWDSGDLSTMTKQTPAKATGAHISIIGHITAMELMRNLGETEQGNGFANRFIWMVVRKSKSLPEGGNVSQEEIQSLSDKLNDVLVFAKGVGEMKKDADTIEAWKRVYEVLGNEKPGMFGAIVGRAHAQVMRLSCLYALLDQSAIIRPEHLAAALAFWDRVEESIKYIFGIRTGNHMADSILAALELQGELDQTDISALFGHNKDSNKIGQALQELDGLVGSRKEETPGKPRTVWYLLNGTTK